jgi:UDP-N-acetylmuramoyl-L-alanyl-D-glutamate--2,6-diaminopimelate ligase
MSSLEASLSKILEQLPVAYTAPEDAGVIVTGVALDSRAVVPGDLFVSLVGDSVDGHDFIPQAIRNGAVAIAGERPLRNLGIPYVRLASARGALSWIAAAFYDWPGRKMRVIGVTGTDGKTTTTNLIYQILRAAGIKAGMISTVNAVIADEQLDTGFHVTTPDAPDVQRYMARMVDAGLTHAILETTSHGWAQHRVDACEFDIGVVTNITHEHLDQHGSYENYRAAKARLFASLEHTHPKPGGGPPLAIVNRDDSSFEYLDHLIKVKKLSYGFSRKASLRPLDVVAEPDGTRFTASCGSLRVGISTSLQGDYNVSNCLAALAATVLGLGIEPAIAARGIGAMKGVPGRMERIEEGQEFVAIVDFAHTPNALKVTLEAARKLVRRVGSEGRLIVVIGSAGLRDREKRRMMAETASELADLTVLTAEDPRSESLDGILAEMANGAKSNGGREGETFWRIPDRGEALRFATRLARAHDIVLACGKGHEQSMCFGSREFPWDDRIAMRAALAELLRVEGPRMPYLPTSDKTDGEWLALR